MPAFVLKKMIMNNFTTQEVDEDIADSIDFMVERVSESFVFTSIYSSFNRNVTYFKIKNCSSCFVDHFTVVSSVS